MRTLGGLAAALLLAGAAAAEPVIRLAMLKFGTVNWLAETVTAEGLDREAGYRLEILTLAGDAATSVAFLSGGADLFVTDWIWTQRRRDAGEDVRFAPYSRALGALMAREGVAGLCDLRGRTVGIVGGDTDKSWLLYRALARRRCGFDLAAETETLHGAPPLMARQLESGAADAVSTYWNWAAKLEAGGARRLIGADEAMAALDVSPAPPLIGFAWNAGRADHAAIAGFFRSVEAAQALLGTSDAAWERLRPRMGAETEAEFLALRNRFREGIAHPSWSEADMAAAIRLHALLVEAAGPAFATAGALDPAGFAPPDAE